MRRLFVAARANPKLWAGLFREQLPDHEILEEMPADGRPIACIVAGRPPAGLNGAALDVFREEPLPAAHAFRRHPRILVSPHVAAPTRPGTAVAAMVENIRRHETGRPMQHVVDRRRGH
jgi:hypothetical protein